MAEVNITAEDSCVDLLTNERADKIFEDFEKIPPLISNDELELIDRMERSAEYSVRPRRATLLLATKSGQELNMMAESHDSAVALAGIKMVAEEYRNRLQEMVGLIDSVIIRAGIALCHCEESVQEEAELMLSEVCHD
jgi:hypothetical protein